MNPVYIGKVSYKKKHIYDGLHQVIIPQELWDAVHKKLTSAPEKRGRKRSSHKFLLQGLVRDHNGTLYTPVFTTKGKQIYRYYVSRDKFEGKEDPAAPSRRFPAQELENFVERTLRSHLENTEKLAEMSGRDHALDYEQLKALSSEYTDLSAEALIGKTAQKITLLEDSLVIETGLHGYEITVPFRMDGDATCAVVIRPASTGTPEDIFSLPPHRLKNLMKGIVWRDEHFRGTSIAAIARREECTDVLVGRLIKESLEIA